MAAATPDPRRRRLIALGSLAGALLLVVGALVVVRALRDDPVQAAPVTTTTTTSTTTTTTIPKPKPVVPVSTELATPKGDVAAYDAPDGKEVGKVGVWYGRPITTPILERDPTGQWLRVRMTERPNGWTAWVRSTDVTTSSTPYRIVLRLGQTRTFVYKDGFPLFDVPVGIGTDRTPTPQGSFFVAVIEKPGPSGYGPIVLDLNAHSEAIQSWEGSGDAITAFHGPFGAQALIRSGGGKVSNGCIRMLPEDQIKMDVIPLGTPVDIVA